MSEHRMLSFCGAITPAAKAFVYQITDDTCDVSKTANMLQHHNTNIFKTCFDTYHTHIMRVMCQQNMTGS